MKNNVYKKALSLMKEIIIFQHKVINQPCSTVQYSCKCCGHNFPLDGDCDKDGYWDCPKCGKVSHSNGIYGTIVARINLWDGKRTLEELIIELEKIELEG